VIDLLIKENFRKALKRCQEILFQRVAYPEEKVGLQKSWQVDYGKELREMYENHRILMDFLSETALPIPKPFLRLLNSP
jgi:hypothetical protein